MLNRAQRRASRAGGGVSLIIAGAGTGKTKTLIEKIGATIKECLVAPSAILVLTFSRKAAEEIRHRVAGEIGKDAGELTAGTFHSFCLKLLRDHRESFCRMADFERFPDVLDDGHREMILRGLIKDSISDFMGMSAGVIYSLAQELETLDEKTRGRLESLGLLTRLEELNGRFSRSKRELCCIDFEDMLRFATSLLESDQPVRRAVLETYRYIFVDEFQDTSGDNFRLLRLMLPERSANLFVVGDDWQSIYGFRDARIEYIVKMKCFFPGARIFRLDLNYRSRKEIVDLSNRFIRKNRFRTNKRLRSHRGKGGSIKAYAVKDLDEEMAAVERIAREELRRTGDVAILYRNNWQGALLRKRCAGLCEQEASGALLPMTMHSSKGLEFTAVIIMGVSDDILPDAYTNIEEERRLLYVAMTRARERLHMVYYVDKSNFTARFAGELGFSPEKVLR